MEDSSSKKSSGLYIHVPFCASKCCYCDFYSVTGREAVGPWLDALHQEMSLYRNRFGVFDTVYVGGGTPTVLEPAVLAAVMHALHENFSIAPDAEITIEANPQDITPATAQALAASGFNRLSLGIQSFDDDVLRFLTRRHTADEGRRAFAAARAAGFDNISVDLMYALPGQSRTQWLRSLAEAVALAPEHLSCYQLTVKEGTELSQRLHDGECSACSSDQERSFFATTVFFLNSRGYEQYEVSSFARTADRYSRHNQKYWHHSPYLGLGPGAHSFHDRERWWNVSSVGEYIRALDSGTAPVAGSELLSDEQLRAEALFLGFRTRRGIERSFLDSSPHSTEALRQLAAQRLVRFSGSRVVPTIRGLLVADSIPRLFL